MAAGGRATPESDVQFEIEAGSTVLEYAHEVEKIALMRDSGRRRLRGQSRRDRSTDRHP